MDVNAPEQSGVGQDPALDTTPLPAEHTPKFWAKAKDEYKNTVPPFVRTTSHYTEGSKRTVFLTKNGHRPARAIQANLVAKRWDPLVSRGFCWTLDLNGERLIVQSTENNGSIDGARWVYRWWSGDRFEDTPLAFTCANGGDYTNSLSSVNDPAAVQMGRTSEEDPLDSIYAKILRRD